MLLDFTKMNGAGNDFVLIDNRTQEVRLSRAQVARLCHRQRGIGADGLILLIPATPGKADWAWQFYNSDGSDAEMCGNGARCFARFVQRLTGAGPRLTFDTAAGIIEAQSERDRVTVTMTAPKDLRLDCPIALPEGPQTVHCIDTGVPHAVLFVPDAERALVQAHGSVLRNHPDFAPRGTNVNFVQVLGPGHIRVRTYERGVEGETLACGTGVTAAALISAQVHGFDAPVRVTVQGGDTLEVRFVKAAAGFAAVRLTGPAAFIFEGRIDLSTLAIPEDPR